MRHALIVDAVRTPRGRGKAHKGALWGVHPQQLLAQVLTALRQRSPVRADDIDDVIIGCVTQSGDQGGCIARNALLAAGYPDRVPGVTINRFCASGLQAVNMAAMGIQSGQMDLAVGGGVESMSRVPMGSDTPSLDANNEHLRRSVYQVPQGISADLIATLEPFTREALDAYALLSQQRAQQAQQGGYFDKSLIPVRHPDTDAVLLERDELPRHGTTLLALAQLPPAFATLGATVTSGGQTLDHMACIRYPQAQGTVHHVHTAGSSSAIADGAAAVLLCSEAYATRHGLTPRARVRATASVGSEPVIMLTGTVPACQRALHKAGMHTRDIDLWEINDAFAAVVLHTMAALELDVSKVNVNGGAIALGHPLGATGAMLLGTVLDELERRNQATALITLCVGGGMGTATIIERI